MLLEMKDVVAGYGNITALKGISLSVPEGSIVTLIGANGAGKINNHENHYGNCQSQRGNRCLSGKRTKK